MLEQYKEKRKQRKLAKKNNPKRRKVLKVLGGIGLVLLVIIVALVITYRDHKDELDNVANNLNFYLNALKRPVDQQRLVPDPINEDDETEFYNKLIAAGVLVEDGNINFMKSKLTSTLKLSVNELAAYFNKTLAAQIKLIGGDVYAVDGVTYLKTTLKFDMTQVAEGTTFEDTGATYLTSTSMFIYVGKKLALKNSYNLLNELTIEENDKMLNLLADLGVSLDQVSPNDLFVEQLQDFVNKLGAVVSVDVDGHFICLN